METTPFLVIEIYPDGLHVLKEKMTPRSQRDLHLQIRPLPRVSVGPNQEHILNLLLSFSYHPSSWTVCTYESEKSMSFTKVRLTLRESSYSTVEIIRDVNTMIYTRFSYTKVGHTSVLFRLQCLCISTVTSSLRVYVHY